MLDLLLLTPAELFANSGVAAALAFAVSIIALAFMSSEFFNMPSLKAFAKNEAYELGVSALIILLAYALIWPGGGVFDRIVGGFALPECAPGQTEHCVPAGQACPEYEKLHPYDPASNTFGNGGSNAYAQADFFLGCRPTLAGDASFPGIFGGTISSLGIAGTDGVVMRKLLLGYQSLMITEMLMGFLSGLSTNLAIPIPVEPMVRLDVGIIPWIGMGQINDLHTLIVDLVGSLWAAFAAQKLLLVFIDESAIPFFLPLGLMMRAFPFSRKTGSTIVAVVFAVQFVYPTSILINQRIWEDIANPAENQFNPGASCSQNNEYCAVDLDCCSNLCVPTGTGILKTCVSPLTDFNKYRTLFSLCYDDKSPEEINDYFENDLSTTYFDNMGLYFQGSATMSTWTKASTRVEEFGQVASEKLDLLQDFTLEALLLPNPRKTMITSFTMVELMVMEVTQFAVLALLFIIIEIVLTLTLMKDFAILIGGEPRIFGISQLV